MFACGWGYQAFRLFYGRTSSDALVGAQWMHLIRRHQVVAPLLVGLPTHVRLKRYAPNQYIWRVAPHVIHCGPYLAQNGNQVST